MNLIKDLRNRQNFQSNNFGFSLVELVVAMSILTLIMPATVGIMKAATQYKDVALENNRNIINSSSFDKIFRIDIEKASAIKVQSSNHIKIFKKDKDGFVCKDWRIQSNVLKSKRSSTSIPDELPTTPSSDVNKWENWTNIFNDTPIKAGTSNKAFVYENGYVKYDLTIGKDKTANNYSGKVSPKAIASSAKNICWTS